MSHGTGNSFVITYGLPVLIMLVNARYVCILNPFYFARSSHVEFAFNFIHVKYYLFLYCTYYVCNLILNNHLSSDR
jgi:uncharacterized membrane protein